MKEKFTIEIEEDIIRKFEIALMLANQSKEEIVESLMREYIISKFSGVAMSMGGVEKEIVANKGDTLEYGKALKKIPKWIEKQKQVPYKIIRAFLQLQDEIEYVRVQDLESRCNDEKKYPDVYVPTFSTNFAQMKLDSEKSHGKVFEITEEGFVCLWDYVKDEILNKKSEFLKIHSVDVGYINGWNQKNMGKTDRKGTGYGQMLYEMKCLECGHTYYANGHDIFLKKCPSCQGGANTGE